MSSSDSKLFIYDDTNKVWRKALATTTGILKSESTLDKTGLATDTLQTAGNASLSSMDGKITACDTGSVTVSSSVLPTGASTSAGQTTTNGHLSTLAGAVVGSELQVDIVSAPTLNTSDAVAQGSLSTIAGAVAGSEMQVDIVSSTPLSVNDTTSQGHLSTLAGTVVGSEVQVDIVSSASLTVSDATAQASLSSIDGKITACDTGSVTVSSSVLPTGASSSAEQITSNGYLSTLSGAVVGSNLNIRANAVKNEGSYENLASNETITAGNNGSSTVDVSNMKVGNLFYNDSSTSSFDTLDVEASVDSGTNWFKYMTIYPNSSGGSTRDYSETNMALHGVTTLRLKNGSSTDTYSNVNCTVVGSP